MRFSPLNTLSDTKNCNFHFWTRRCAPRTFHTGSPGMLKLTRVNQQDYYIRRSRKMIKLALKDWKRSTGKHKDTVGLTLNGYKDINSVWITNTIISCAFVATLVLSSFDIQRHGDNTVVRKSDPGDVWFGKALSCAVKINFIILIHCLIFWGMIDAWWSCRV